MTWRRHRPPERVGDGEPLVQLPSGVGEPLVQLPSGVVGSLSQMRGIHDQACDKGRLQSANQPRRARRAGAVATVG
jgi:hypothetical protein